MRIALGAVMFAHGAQKALGWFGGAGLHPTLEYFGRTLGIPMPLAVVAVAAEFLGGIGLMLGLLGRICALGIGVNMAVAMLLVHLQNGFFMNWFGTKAGEGFEYHLLALALAVPLVIRGAGAFSLDRVLERRWMGRTSGGGLEPLAGWREAPTTGAAVHFASLWMSAEYRRR
ncbi:MAG TPA: DoxX family protein [Bryobacteraceae bacterium]|nr:DoxX family protein [Bryobacteraceae bacterium]